MVNYVELFSFSFSVNETFDTKNDFIGLNIQNNYHISLLDNDIIGVIDGDPINIELISYKRDGVLALGEPFKMSDCVINHKLQNKVNFAFIISKFIKVVATLCNNFKIQNMKNQIFKPKNKKFNKNINKHVLKKIVGTNESIKFYSIDYIFNKTENTVKALFKVDIPNNGFMPFSTDMVNYLQGVDTNNIILFDEHDLSGVSIRTMLDEKLENYTIAQDIITEPMSEVDKAKLHPLILYPFQEKTVSWMLKRERSNYNVMSEDFIQKNILLLLNELQLGYLDILNESYFYNSVTKYCVSRQVAINLILFKNSLLAKSITEGYIKGGYGVLCEDMSLGKTVECISTIIANKFSENQIANYNLWQKSNLNENEYKRPLINSTLVVCTDTILDQWVSSFNEFSETLGYQIYNYRGFKEFKKQFPNMHLQKISNELYNYDIIVTSYSTLVKEVSFVDFADRNMTTEAKTRSSGSPKHDYSSPLCAVTFARILLDEVQSLSFSSLSTVNRISRIHTWAVSATPLKSNNFEKCLAELKNLLSCLSFSPFNDSNFKNITLKNFMEWKIKPFAKKDNIDYEICVSPSKLVEALIDVLINKDFLRRHARKTVQDQLKIPKQHKYLVPIELYPIETEKYKREYNNLLDRFRQGRINLDDVSSLNMHLTDLTMLCVEGIYTKLRAANIHYKSSILHKSSSEENSIEINSMEIILKSMIMENRKSLNATKKNLINMYIDNARYVLEKLENFAEAEVLLLKAKLLLDAEINLIRNADKNSIDESFEITLLNLSHGVHFFLGNCYYQMGQSCSDDKSKESFAVKESQEYEIADTMRRIALSSQIEEVNESMNILKEEQIHVPPSLPIYEQIDISNLELIFNQYLDHFYTKNSKEFVESVGDETEEENDVQKKKNIQIFEKKIKPLFIELSNIIAVLNKQMKLVADLYEESISLLKIPILADKEHTDVSADAIKELEQEEEPVVTEYENGLQIQDKIYENFELINLVLSNRKFLLENDFSATGNKQFFVLDKYKKFKKEFLITDTKNSWPEIKRLFLNLKIVQETPIVKIASKIMNQFNFGDDSISHVKWQKSIQELNKIFNKKISYFKSLQSISDKVMDIDVSLEEKFERLNIKFDFIIRETNQNLKKLVAKNRYLNGLGTIQNGEEMSCLICIDAIKIGSMLECGHKFCRFCIKTWLETKKICPLCNTPVNISSIHDFLLEKDDLISAKNLEITNFQNSAKDGRFQLAELCLNDYKLFPELNKVKKVYIQNLNYGAKVDILVKLLSYIDMKDDLRVPSQDKQQVVLYCRFTKIIGILADILTDCGFNTLAAGDIKSRGKVIAEFKKNKQNRVLILTTDANAGLTLVNASILILFDPILENSVETQTLNRISRIGQQRETIVFNFITMNTVEENIIRYKEFLKKQDTFVQLGIGNIAEEITKLSNKDLWRKRKSREMINEEKEHQEKMKSSFLVKCLFYNENLSNVERLP
ncbi:hypothetical protein QEN19_003326 [Hanseniaspora menglaensis]